MVRRGLGLGLAAFCLIANEATGVLFPRSRRCADLLLAGIVLGLALCAGNRRWRTWGQYLSGSLLLVALLDLRGWPVVCLWLGATGLWHWRETGRPIGALARLSATAHRNGSGRV